MENLSTAFMTQMFEGFNKLQMKAHEVEFHLNKLKKRAKQSV